MYDYKIDSLFGLFDSLGFSKQFEQAAYNVTHEITSLEGDDHNSGLKYNRKKSDNH